VANSYVSEIRDHIKEGQIVKVKVMTISDDGKISLSIKKAVDTPPRAPRFNQNGGSSNSPPFHRAEKKPASTGNAFEDMLSKFKQNSEERMSDIKKNIDGKRKNGSRRSGTK